MAQAVTERIAANVRLELAKQRITKTALAEHLGVSKPWVFRRVHGRTPFRAEELVAVADVLGVTVASLYDGRDVT